MHSALTIQLNNRYLFLYRFIDPNVKNYIYFRDDMEMMLNKIVPEGLPYRHSCEGPDDMVKYFFLVLKCVHV